MFLKKSVRIGLMAAAAILAVGSSGDATAGGTLVANTGTLNVTATVVNNCTIATTNVAFGNYDPTSGTDAAATGTLTLTCTPGASMWVGLNGGGNELGGPSTTDPNRRMKFGTNYLPYHLYQPTAGFGNGAATTTAWGNDTSANTATVAYTSTGAADSTNVYGVIPHGTMVPAGGYSDAVTVTVNF